ncbi:PhoX family phosphatase [Nodosilinea sp. P-1105]|uniref:PhoX family protein n=1 Tax=Nodosilinea sp. P-1105 TaxID=2546229 RepID=UPI00146A892B|nr:PhoX family phosphatase [Nodosilinea sp. P-1105]NMF84797.1 PhoX family phosphatase [Nodosilinea sp. P-1105]
MTNQRDRRSKYVRILQGALPADQLEHGDEPQCNRSTNPTFESIVNRRLQRRQVLKGSLALAVTSMFTGPAINALRTQSAAAATPMLGFTPIPVSEADTIEVPAGYTARTLTPWGEPISGRMPAYSLDNSGADQGVQVGMHHDGMHFYPIEGRDPYEGSSRDGLLVMNHEYIEPRYMHRVAIGQALDAGNVPMQADGSRVSDQVLKELNAHGVSVVRIRQQNDGTWEVQRDGRNRRITGLTPMEISGPVRGSDLVKTKYSPNGTSTRGTLNNCAHGVTPWNTYLTCEENWARYFVNTDQMPDSNQGDPTSNQPREHKRYGVATDVGRYGWELADNGADEYVRFDASTKASSPTGDYRNEPNTFGWVVEIDPFRPNSTPVKRTALGRFAHEGVVFQTPVEGQPIVCYSGDDARFEYIYKYVSNQPYRRATANGSLLDDGTLYVAKFNDDGSGEWIALNYGQNGLTAANGFANQAEVLVNTRAAADFVGATKMDRPEWGAVDPGNGQVYFTLTNNTRRTAEQVDAVNPRPDNRWGQIVRWSEAGNNPTATSFQWDLFVLAGPENDSEKLSGESLNDNSIFAAPDGLWFDASRRLWIQTDISESVMNTGDFAQFGNNQMLGANPETGEIRRFLTGPIGQEITGVVTTPDQRTMFINVQHPGATVSADEFAAGQINSRWPDNNPSIYPRSATVVITKNDGGVIGS